MIAERAQHRNALRDLQADKRDIAEFVAGYRERRLGRRTALTLPLLPPPQKN